MVHWTDVFKLHCMAPNRIFSSHSCPVSYYRKHWCNILKCTHWYKFESLKFGKQFFNERFQWLGFILVELTNRRKVTHSLANALWIQLHVWLRNQASSWKIRNRRRDLWNVFYLQWWSNVLGDELHPRM